MRYLAIDLGDKRTGVAIGDSFTGIATPLDVINTSSESERFTRLRDLIEWEGPGALVVGWPLNMDGSVGPNAEKCKAFADKLSEATRLPVHLHDERLSSAAADEQMAMSGLTHKQKKARRDAMAAANILRGFFEALEAEKAGD
ncbi:MAG: Holliday junction resolvase RuvX [Phycisphaeraceae bacterium]|nr:Holliday junction resolvase RuvX [Phycisphaeraceae bacterium]